MNGHTEMLKAAVADINGLVLQGAVNWTRANSAINRITAVIEGLEKETKAREQAYKAAIEDAKASKAKAQAEAAERGEEVLGGEVIHFDLKSGEQTVLVD